MTTLKFGRPAFRNFDFIFNDLMNSIPAASEKLSPVPVNISEHENAYELELLAPGRNKEDIKINIEQGLLTISFEKNQDSAEQNTKQIRKEFDIKNFKRSFTLDEKIDAGSITARYENGLLKLTLPRKTEEAKEVKKIDIQ